MVSFICNTDYKIFFVLFPIRIGIIYVILWFIYDFIMGRFNIFVNLKFSLKYYLHIVKSPINHEMP